MERHLSTMASTMGGTGPGDCVNIHTHSHVRGRDGAQCLRDVSVHVCKMALSPQCTLLSVCVSPYLFTGCMTAHPGGCASSL